MKKPFRSAVLATILVVSLSGLLLGCGDGLPGDAVAKVGDAYVSEAEFNRQVEDASRYYGVTSESDPEMYAQMQGIILDDLIQVEVAKQFAAGLGVEVTDADVDDAVDSLVTDYFSGDQAALESELAAQGMTMEDVRKERRDSLTIQGVYDAVVQDVTSVPDDDIEAYYAANQEDYATEQTVKARHILITVAGSATEDDSSSTTTTSIASPTSTTEAENPESTTTTTEVSDLAWAEALATAAHVRVELLKGGSWDELAEEYSDDESTKHSGGDLGEVSQGALADKFGYEFDSTLFTLELDEISEPVKTSTGYHIIQVTVINDPVHKTLEQVRDEIVDTLISDAKYAAWTAWVEEAKREIGVTYRKDLQPTTTTTDSTSTTVAADSGGAEVTP